MSKPVPGLRYDYESILQWLDGMRYRPRVKEIRLYGSRSPRSKKEAREDSDWDMVVIHDGSGYIPDPKKRGLLIDLHGTRIPNLEVTRKDAILIYPVNGLDA